MPKPKAPPPLLDEDDLPDIQEEGSIFADAALDDLDLPEIAADEESERVIQPDALDH